MDNSASVPSAAAEHVPLSDRSASVHYPTLFTRAGEQARELRALAGYAAALSATDYPSPPTEGIVMAQSLYREIGLEFFWYFLKWGGLLPSDDVIDIGCGGGRMAAPLLYYLEPTSRYAGFDVHAESIAWCQQNITSKWPNFEFQAIDVENSLYNPRGLQKSGEFMFPFENQSFSFAILTSVFTHLPRSEVAHYLAETARVMRRGGRVFCTAYLLTPESRAATTRFASGLKFDHLLGENPIHSTEQPLMAVAQIEQSFREDVAAVGLTIDRIAWGWWSGMETGNTRQDILVLRKT